MSVTSSGCLSAEVLSTAFGNLVVAMVCIRDFIGLGAWQTVGGHYISLTLQTEILSTETLFLIM